MTKSPNVTVRRSYLSPLEARTGFAYNAHMDRKDTLRPNNPNIVFPNTFLGHLAETVFLRVPLIFTALAWLRTPKGGSTLDTLGKMTESFGQVPRTAGIMAEALGVTPPTGDVHSTVDIDVPNVPEHPATSRQR